MGNKTLHGLEHEAIDKIAAAILLCEDSRPEDMKKQLLEAIGIVVEMRVIHDKLMQDHDGGKDDDKRMPR